MMRGLIQRVKNLFRRKKKSSSTDVARPKRSRRQTQKPQFSVLSLEFFGGSLELQRQSIRLATPTRYFEIHLPWAAPQLPPQRTALPETESTELSLDSELQSSLRTPGQFAHHNTEFWAFVDSFLKEQTSTHTRRAYEKDLTDFLGYLKTSGKPMNVHTLIDYRSLLETRLSDRTGKALSRVSINRKIATLKSFLNFLVLNGVIPNNPAKAVKSFRAGRESPTRDIPDDMVRRMLELPDRHKVAGRMHYAILMVLFHLGLRRSELIDLRTSDLFQESGMNVMRVRGKGDKERILPLPEDVHQAIVDYLHIARKDIATDQVLFTPVKNNVSHDYAKNLNPEAIAYIVKHYAKRAGITYKVSPHSARATAVSNALDHMASHRAVQHMAGWSSPLMVTRYDKRKADLRNSAVRFVNYNEV